MNDDRERQRKEENGDVFHPLIHSHNGPEATADQSPSQELLPSVLRKQGPSLTAFPGVSTGNCTGSKAGHSLNGDHMGCPTCCLTAPAPGFLATLNHNN